MSREVYEILAKNNMNRVLDHNLEMPSKKDYEIISFIKNIIESYKYYEVDNFMPSIYFIEINKAIDNIGYYYKDEVKLKLLNILCDLKVEKSEDKMYSSGFGNNRPELLVVPKKLNSLSYIYIAHELLHLLKDSNNNEYKNLYLYSEVLPIFEEMKLGLNEKNKRKARYAIYERIANLKDITKRLNETDNIVIEGDYLKEYFNLSGNVYYLSYYYSVLLLDLYDKYKNDINIDISKVLLSEQTTKDILEKYELLKDFNPFTFSNASKNLIKKCI